MRVEIGKRYIYDALNKTNLAITTNTVTVIEKGKRTNHYFVISDDSKDIFEVHKNYLTPYNESADNVVIRYKGGIPDFKYDDVETIKYLMGTILYLSDLIKKSDNINEIRNIVSTIPRDIMDNGITLMDKISKYVTANTLLEFVKECGTLKKQHTEESDMRLKECEDYIDNFTMAVHHSAVDFIEKYTNEHSKESFNSNDFCEELEKYLNNNIDVDKSKFMRGNVDLADITETFNETLDILKNKYKGFKFCMIGMNPSTYGFEVFCADTDTVVEDIVANHLDRITINENGEDCVIYRDILLSIKWEGESWEWEGDDNDE